MKNRKIYRNIVLKKDCTTILWQMFLKDKSPSGADLNKYVIQMRQKFPIKMLRYIPDDKLSSQHLPAQR